MNFELKTETVSVIQNSKLKTQNYSSLPLTRCACRKLNTALAVIALLILRCDGDFACAFGRGDLQTEQTIAVGESLAPAETDGRAGLRSSL
ncbi:MAG TPA: hypothetical protein VE821_14825, partial [Pyrinomonadaceae bacterium]|nr:hypothetical protein [Pyrinomonadaceae bacterium]